MAAKTGQKADKVDKKIKKDKKEKNEKRPKEQKQEKAANAAFSLLADEKAINTTLSSLFATKPTPPQRQAVTPKAKPESEDEEEDADAELSEIDEELDDDAEVEDADSDAEIEEAEVERERLAEDASKRKRKRKDADDDLENTYMRKLEKEEEKDAEKAAAERATKRQKSAVAEMGHATAPDSDDDEIEIDLDADSDIDEPKPTESVEDKDKATPPPKHETQQAAENEASKANRTVFLGNVSTTAITSKPARKTLIKHLGSFFDKLPEPKDGQPKHKLESIRFRSTAFSASLPKKAAFAKKELMDATTKSTNAYAVYSSPALAREAARRLNATKILDRHLRVDEIAHPAKVDHKRCVFVGNLHFVDDESNIQAANADDGREHRKPAKQPADVEEGLWRTFSRHGAVESVRVIRDSATRVGKGIAYVQFADENSVEAALLDNEKKFPPMLPRKLRVSRAKAVKRNVKPGSGRPSSAPRPVEGKKSGYQRKITAEEASQMGRTGKLFGKAAAAQSLKQSKRTSTGGPTRDRPVNGLGGGMDGIKKPEAFIFEGHRATAKQGTKGLKLGGKNNKQKPGVKGKPTNRSAKRGATFKAGGGKKKSGGG